MWLRVSFWLWLAVLLSMALSLWRGGGAESLGLRFQLILAPVAAAAACISARKATPGAAHPFWALVALGSLLAAMGHALSTRGLLLQTRVEFPTMEFHLLLLFHLAVAEGAILALRPARDPAVAVEIALDGMLVLLGTSAVVLRLALDEPLVQGWVSLPQGVAMTLGQFGVAASLFFPGLLLFWRDTDLPSMVPEAVMTGILVLAFGHFLALMGLDPLPGSGDSPLAPVRLAGWFVLTVAGGLATVGQDTSRPRYPRGVAARRVREMIIPGAAIFLTLWALDASRRGTVSSLSRVVIGVMGVVLALRIAAALRAVQQESERRRFQEEVATRARLRAITAQMSPHFLFNSLHAISALVRRDATTAERALDHLGRLLRYGLDTGEELVTLGEEWQFTAAYLDLQKIRFGSRLQVRREIPAPLHACLVPPFILQPLVENSVKYAVSPFRDGGRVRVSAEREGEFLHLVVSDSGPGMDPDKMKQSPGIGLKGVRSQLESHFPGKWELRGRPAEGGGWIMEIVLPVTSPTKMPA